MTIEKTSDTTNAILRAVESGNDNMLMFGYSEKGAYCQIDSTVFYIDTTCTPQRTPKLFKIIKAGGLSSTFDPKLQARFDIQWNKYLSANLDRIEELDNSEYLSETYKAKLIAHMSAQLKAYREKTIVADHSV